MGVRSPDDPKGWRMVKSEIRRDAETLVRNPSPRLFDKKFRNSKKVKTNHAKTRLRDLSKTLPRFRDPVKIFRDLRLSRYHSPPLSEERVTCKIQLSPDNSSLANSNLALTRTKIDLPLISFTHLL